LNSPGHSGNPDPATSNAPFRIYNIGNNNPIELLQYIQTLEGALGRKAELDLLPLQPGDVPSTSADTSELERQVGYRPATSVEYGVGQFVKWYKSFYGRDASAGA